MQVFLVHIQVSCIHMYICCVILQQAINVASFCIGNNYIHVALDLEEKLMTYKVKDSDTVKIIKDNIREEFGIPVTEQVMMLEGKELQDDCILSECLVQCVKLNVIIEFGKNICIVTYISYMHF